MKRATILFWFLGLLILILLVSRLGWLEVGRAIASIRWGLLLVCLLGISPLVASALCWRTLIPAPFRPGLITLLKLRWICGSVNSLLPVASIGGEVVRARLLVQRKVPGPIAGASIVADLTVAIGDQSVFAIFGVILLIQYEGSAPAAWAVGFGVLLFSLLIVAFVWAQKSGLFLNAARKMERVVKVGNWEELMGSAQALDDALLGIYRRVPDLLLAATWRMFNLFLSAAITLVTMYLLGSPIGLVEAIILESLAQAVRNAAFMIPGALGVQEGTYVFLGTLLGIEPTTALALALINRARSILIGVPGVLAWPLSEGRRLLRSSS